MKQVFIIHKWEGTPDSDWYGWLSRELENKGIRVSVPQMPDTNNPVIADWVSCLVREIGMHPNQETYLVGHSMGVQAILRYLGGLEKNETVGGVLSVAGFVTIKKGSVSPEGEKIIEPWLSTRIDLKEASLHSQRFVSIFSTDDPYVPIEDAKVFEKELSSKIIIIPGAGHFTEATGYKELHVALNELLKML